MQVEIIIYPIADEIPRSHEDGRLGGALLRPQFLTKR